MTAWQTWLVDTTDIATLAHITSFEGILSDGPVRGDFLDLDWTPGAVWQPGPAGTYSYPVPVTMLSHSPDVALHQLLTLQALKGVQRTFTRRLTVNGVQVSHTHQGVIASATEVTWDFRLKDKISAVLVVQNLSGGWS